MPSAYENRLREARAYEKKGNLERAIERLDKAEGKAPNAGELRHLRVWRTRLKKELAECRR